MRDIAKPLRVASYHFRHITATPRIPVVFLMEALFIWENLRRVAVFSASVGIPASPCAFSHLTNDFVCQLVMMAGVIIIFCDAPFRDEGFIYLLPRAGRSSWALGQILCIVGMAFLYVLFLLLMSILPLAGHLELGNQWGKIWGTLAKTDAGAAFGITLSVSEYMVTCFPAVKALLVSIALEWACVVWLGLFIYFLNGLTDSPSGTVAGAFCILLDICIANDWTHWANRFSPITLAQLNSYSGYSLMYNITLDYGVRFFSVGIGVLFVLGILSNYKEKLGNFFQIRGE